MPAPNLDKTHPFGELTYEKDLSITPAGLAVRGVIAGIMTVLGIGAIAGGFANDKLGVAAIGAVMAIGAAPAWYFLAYRERFGLFRFYKNGVESVTRHGTQSLSYDQL
ncbi:MAG: hypothetical protein ACRCZF_28420, partial [Gemmataceae bacterium]